MTVTITQIPSWYSMWECLRELVTLSASTLSVECTRAVYNTAILECINHGDYILEYFLLANLLRAGAYSLNDKHLHEGVWQRSSIYTS